MAENFDGELGLELLRRMLRVRKFELQIQTLAATGELPGPAHLYTGQEGVAAGVCAALRDDDYVSSTHRGHGHVVAKGSDLAACMAELLARETGVCRGKGGSMHMADMSLGIIGANGIVAAGIPIAVGAALSAQMRGSDQVAVAFFGEGATNEGAFHESMNLASSWTLPVIFVCENNGYGQMTRMEKVTATTEMFQRAEAYKMPSRRVDGNDCFAVNVAAVDAIARARRGEGPSFIEAMTYRWREHAEGLEVLFAGLRDQSEIDEWISRDPVARHEAVLRENGVAGTEIDELNSAIAAEIDAAVEFARNSPVPPREQAFTDLWADADSAPAEVGVA
ncbi:MAG TPA: thiamine pyrophosphate-dependent dehydrogenase E1 component subunit alpha [Solirubrobacteraceae bacterium]